MPKSVLRFASTLTLVLASTIPLYAMSEVDIHQAIQEASPRWMKLQREASDLGAQGKTEEAEKKLKQIISEREKLGRDTGGEKMELARVLAKSPSRKADAETLFKELIQNREKQYGVDDTMVIWPLREYSTFLLAEGKKDESKKLLQRIDYIEKKNKEMPVAEVNAIASSNKPNAEKARHLVVLAKAFTDKDKEAHALYCLNEAVKLDQKNAIAFCERSNINVRLGKYKSARSDVDKAILLNPKLSSAYYRRALLNEGDNKLDKALLDFDKAIECNASDTEALGSRGKLLANLGRNEDAVRDFSKVIEIKPELTWPYVQRGIVYKDMGRQEKAVEDFSGLIKRYPKNFDYYELRAQAYEKQKEWKLALADFDEVIKLMPDYAGGKVGRERVLKEMEK